MKESIVPERVVDPFEMLNKTFSSQKQALQGRIKDPLVSCNTLVFTLFALNIYDVNIVWNHGNKLKSKALPLINVLCIGDQG